MPITVSGTSITFNDSTTQTTAFTGGGVTSLNGQTGAITNTGFDNIGSYAFLANCTTTRCSPGTTIAGSNLRYQTTITQFGGTTLVSEGSFTSSPRTRWYVQQLANRENSGNTGYVAPQGSATVSGTWRAMTFIPERTTSFCGESNTHNSDSYIGLWVRIS